MNNHYYIALVSLVLLLLCILIAIAIYKYCIKSGKKLEEKARLLDEQAGLQLRNELELLKQENLGLRGKLKLTEEELNELTDWYEITSRQRFAKDLQIIKLQSECDRLKDIVRFFEERDGHKIKYTDYDALMCKLSEIENRVVQAIFVEESTTQDMQVLAKMHNLRELVELSLLSLKQSIDKIFNQNEENAGQEILQPQNQLSGNILCNQPGGNVQGV